LGVDNKSPKTVSVACQFIIDSSNGSQRCVDGKVKVGAGKFESWQEEELNEEEKKGDSFLVFFAINDEKYAVQAKGRFWYSTIEMTPVLNILNGTIVKYRESYIEERDKKEEKVQKSIVAQRVSAFSQGVTGSSTFQQDRNMDPNRLTGFYTGTLKKIIE